MEEGNIKRAEQLLANGADANSQNKASGPTRTLADSWGKAAPFFFLTGCVLLKALALGPGVARGSGHLTFPPGARPFGVCWVLCRATRLGAACSSLRLLKDVLTLRRCFATTALFLAAKMRQGPPHSFLFCGMPPPHPSAYPQPPPRKSKKNKEQAAVQHATTVADRCGGGGITRHTRV